MVDVAAFSLSWECGTKLLRTTDRGAALYPPHSGIYLSGNCPNRNNREPS
jgi:hypothetical protein